MTSNNLFRSLYRGVFVYGVIQAYKRFNVSRAAKAAFMHIEKEFWKSSNTFISIKPRTRYFGCAIFGSIACYLMKESYFSFFELKNPSHLWHNIAMSSIISTVLGGLTLSFSPKFLILASIFGCIFGVTYTLAFKLLVKRKFGDILKTEKFSDKDFDISQLKP
ncbi:unnamed protein product [Moneuplotes crassus]|uniref:Uncharacterized protein n=1 Tax=Euplotes crassus TaxID=5936 RepID=A0AAD1Y1U8_EUPCR|nr:unnamed protein product [Moneuplotes crassus]